MFSQPKAIILFDVSRGEQVVQVLEVAARQLVVGNDLDLAVTLLLDDNVVAQVVGAALDLDAVLEELLEGGDVEDLVVGGLGSVDDELPDLLAHLSFLSLSSNILWSGSKGLPSSSASEPSSVKGK